MQKSSNSCQMQRHGCYVVHNVADMKTATNYNLYFAMWSHIASGTYNKRMRVYVAVAVVIVVVQRLIR
jgi:hypothetical protein